MEVEDTSTDLKTTEMPPSPASYTPIEATSRIFSPHGNPHWGDIYEDTSTDFLLLPPSLPDT